MGGWNFLSSQTKPELFHRRENSRIALEALLATIVKPLLP
jgi:hypothetical protein